MRSRRVGYRLPISRCSSLTVRASNAARRSRVGFTPERGPVAPDVFIQLAEEIGVVSNITKFMLRQACRDCLKWPSHIAVSVNLSVLDLRNGEIIPIVAEILSETGLDPSRLHLEVTESCLMEEAAKVQTILQELRARGITIAIDDFGTGYSSLSYLDALPLDIIKIDRSFVRNIRGRCAALQTSARYGQSGARAWVENRHRRGRDQ